MKNYLLVGVLALSLITSFWGGLYTGLGIGQSEGKTAALVVNLKQQQLSNLRMCFFSLETDMLRNVQEWSEQRVQRLMWRHSLCNEYLDLLGSSWLDEETSYILGEMRLFFDGYITTIREISRRQLKLEIAYLVLSVNDPKDVKVVQETETEQLVQLRESEKFLDRLLLLIGEAWSS
jgi:hypothetical protein